MSLTGRYILFYPVESSEARLNHSFAICLSLIQSGKPYQSNDTMLRLVTKKTSNTGAEKLWSRILKPRFLTNPLLESF